ncbi:MAG: molybdopterin-dependent oxidoreductase [Firmicutes bacterium]|nr:molybdopterin-dependent oxidoreductase [Bacillota bacterium]
MNKKLSLWVLLLVSLLAVSLVLGGCQGDKEPQNEGEPVTASEWEIKIIFNSEEVVVPIEDIRGMIQTTIEVERDETTAYTGVILKDVLALAGVTEAAVVTLEADDGYSASLEDATAIFSDQTILALQIDGEDWDSDSGPIRLVSTEASGKSWVGQLKLITVE